MMNCNVNYSKWLYLLLNKDLYMLKRVKVLIVDDDLLNCLVLEKML